MLHPLRYAALAALTLFTAVAPAAAAPADVRVRIEGVHETIVDRVVRTDGHAIRATSDSAARRCDGTNAGRYPSPGPTSTAAAVDALTVRGLDFDGNWTPGTDDYFITRLGPERQDGDQGFYWAIAHNGVYQQVGGCQERVATGDEVLFANDGQGDRPLLWATPAAATVGAGDPLTIAVRQGDFGTAPPARTPFAGASLGAVDANGRPAAAQPEVTASDVAGAATVRFPTAGWWRIKARAASSVGGPAPLAVASAAVAICVTSVAAPSCTGLAPGEEPARADVPDLTPDPRPPTPTPTATATPKPGPSPTLSAPSLLAGYAKTRRLAVGWTVTTPGVGVRSWVLSARTAPSTSWAPRASGTGAVTKAVFALPVGRASEVRLQVTDNAGRTATAEVGVVIAPLDERASAVRRSGRWTSTADANAWSRRYAIGRQGATLKVRLEAGTPTVLVRGVRRRATIELRAGGRRETYAISGSATKATRSVALSKAVKAGTLTVRIVSGAVGVDGVAAG